ncbi:response regulator [uncultured Metabacillus sp.]|uniref:response regulator transcription factor n=1 Tax=uncultured Metabacillus sp. TaxID=2860135 RepID=UPI00261CA60A|nr:response regulator [uncultured Metabacillus sp.]
MKILLVDDEPFALRTLKEMIQGAKSSWEITAAVEDGEEAITVLKKHEVDLVISDIRMPAVDGLELSKYIEENFSTVKVILLTGYKDFGYAQQALRYGVVDYLLKPTSFESLFESIERIENCILKEKNIYRLTKKRERDILEKRLDDLLFGLPYPYYDDELIPKFHEILVFTCCLKDASLLPKGWVEIHAYSAIKNIIEEWFLPFGKAYVTVQEQHLAVIVFLNDTEEKSLVYKEMLGRLYETIQALLKIELIIGFGFPCRKLTELHVHYRESIYAMEDARKTDFSFVAFYGDIKQNTDEVKHLEKKYEGKKNRRVIEIVLEKMRTKLSEDITLKVLAEEVYLNPTYLGRIFKEETGESFSSYLIKLRIEKAKQLLRNPALKIYEVCEQVGYNDPAHFTHVFKKSLGITPQEYKLRS